MPEREQTVELRDCTIYIRESDGPYTNGRLGVYIAIMAKDGGEIVVSQTGSPMSGHAKAIYANAYGPESEAK